MSPNPNLILDISRSYPTTLTSTISKDVGVANDGRTNTRLFDVTLYHLAFNNGGTLGYIDPEDNKLYKCTLVIENSPTGDGKVGLITLDNYGKQINKAPIKDMIFTFNDLMDIFTGYDLFKAEQAADGSRLDINMVLENNHAESVQFYGPTTQSGGRRRKSKKSKKSKRHTRR